MSGTCPLERKVSNSGWFQVSIVKELKTWLDHPHHNLHHHLPPHHHPHHLPPLYLHPVVIQNLIGDNFWNRPYIRYCCRQLKNYDFVRNLVQKLYTTQCLQDFILLVTQLADGSLLPLNIAFLLCLEHAKWQSLKSTTQMRFCNVTKKFWLVVYHLLKGKGL